jgi:micrococcal nuclease
MKKFISRTFAAAMVTAAISSASILSADETSTSSSSSTSGEKESTSSSSTSGSSSSSTSESTSSSSELQVLKGKVTKVVDGDSIVVKSSSGEETIHLEGIDAPEFKQSGGDEATSYLKKLLKDKDVEVRWAKRDSFKRILGMVYVEDTFINLEMINKGWAWHFDRYNKSGQLAEAQKTAKAAKLGLWKETDPTAPWDFRKANPRSE